MMIQIPQEVITRGLQRELDFTDVEIPVVAIQKVRPVIKFSEKKTAPIHLKRYHPKVLPVEIEVEITSEELLMQLGLSTIEIETDLLKTSEQSSSFLPSKLQRSGAPWPTENGAEPRPFSQKGQFEEKCVLTGVAKTSRGSGANVYVTNDRIEALLSLLISCFAEDWKGVPDAYHDRTELD